MLKSAPAALAVALAVGLAGAAQAQGLSDARSDINFRNPGAVQ